MCMVRTYVDVGGPGRQRGVEGPFGHVHKTLSESKVEEVLRTQSTG